MFQDDKSSSGAESLQSEELASDKSESDLDIRTSSQSSSEEGSVEVSSERESSSSVSSKDLHDTSSEESENIVSNEVSVSLNERVSEVLNPNFEVLKDPIMNPNLPNDNISNVDKASNENPPVQSKLNSPTDDNNSFSTSDQAENLSYTYEEVTVTDSEPDSLSEPLRTGAAISEIRTYAEEPPPEAYPDASDDDTSSDEVYNKPFPELTFLKRIVKNPVVSIPEFKMPAYDVPECTLPSGSKIYSSIVPETSNCQHTSEDDVKNYDFDDHLLSQSEHERKVTVIHRPVIDGSEPPVSITQSTEHNSPHANDDNSESASDSDGEKSIELSNQEDFSSSDSYVYVTNTATQTSISPQEPVVKLPKSLSDIAIQTSPAVRRRSQNLQHTKLMSENIPSSCSNRLSSNNIPDYIASDGSSIVTGQLNLNIAGKEDYVSSLILQNESPVDNSGLNKDYLDADGDDSLLITAEISSTEDVICSKPSEIIIPDQIVNSSDLIHTNKIPQDISHKKHDLNLPLAEDTANLTSCNIVIENSDKIKNSDMYFSCTSVCSSTVNFSPVTPDAPSENINAMNYKLDDISHSETHMNESQAATLGTSINSCISVRKYLFVKLSNQS